MTSVTNRIKEIKQPRGGYIKPSSFTVTPYDDGIELHEKENVHASIVGMAVDYLTRLILTDNRPEAFKISLRGAAAAEQLGREDASAIAIELLDEIHGLDQMSVINTCKLVTFDIWYRNPHAAFSTKGPDETNPDLNTIENIQNMIVRSLTFFKEYGPVTQDGFDFLPPNYTREEAISWTNGETETFGGYTQTVSAGDGDFLTADTLWDFKVSKNKPKSAHTLQLLMYWIMGQHSEQDVYKNISKIGIFNPRLNAVYRLDMASVPKETIEIVEKDVIGYR